MYPVFIMMLEREKYAHDSKVSDRIISQKGEIMRLVLKVEVFLSNISTHLCCQKTTQSLGLVGPGTAFGTP